MRGHFVGNNDVHLVFHLIRHGESELNQKPWLIGGRSPATDLSQLGARQSRALGDRLSDEGLKIDLFFSSPLLRATKTAAILCETLGFPYSDIELTEALTELSQGDWEGSHRDKIYTESQLRHINTMGHLFTPPGGESQRMVERRVSNWLEDRITNNHEVINNLEAREAKRTLNIVVVSHAITLKCLFHYILRFSDRFIYRFQIDNCSLSRFIFCRDGWFIHSVNDSHHLRFTSMPADKSRVSETQPASK